jgi:predicted RNA-binding protein (virulence factor B family)
MLKTGRIQTAYINRFSNYGAFLSDEPNGEQEVLLPNKFLKSEYEIDQTLEVFIYRDSEDRLTATTQKPFVQVGEMGQLKVVGKIKTGYFLNNNLDKDIFLPYKEAKHALELGDKVMVKMLIDDTDHLYVSMRIYDMLSINTALKIGDQVNGVVYEIKEEMGAFVAIDGLYHGFIPKHECYPEVFLGAKLSARITKIREDGRANLSIRQKSAVQIHDDEKVVLEALDANEGFLPLNDYSDPAVIKTTLHMSKKAYKRVVGKLLKDGCIEMTEKGIKKINS